MVSMQTSLPMNTSWFLNENDTIHIWISSKFSFNGSIDNDLALVQVMAWYQAGNKPLPTNDGQLTEAYTHHWVKPFACKYFYKKYKHTCIKYHSYIEMALVIEILHKFRRKYVIDDLNLMCILLFSGELTLKQLP